MDFYLAQSGAVEGEKQTMQGVVEKFHVETGDELRDLLLCDGRGEVDIPGGQAGEGFRIA